MKTITKTSKMTLKEFLTKKPKAISKVKLAKMIGAKQISTGYAVIFIEW